VDASSYQLFRLWSGICSIGLNLGLIWAVYGTSLLVTGLPGMTLDGALPLYGLIVAILIVIAFLPFEILIGYAGEAAFSRTRQALSEWLKDWSRPQWFVILGMVAGISLFGFIGRMDVFSQCIAVGVISALAAGFLISLPYLVHRLGGMRSNRDAVLEEAINQHLDQLDSPPLKLQILEDGGEEGVNGAILPFQRHTLTINQAASEELEVNELAALALREQWFHQKGQGLMCVAIVIGWIMAGLTMALFLPGSALPADTALQQGLSGAAIMTTWCFLALFVWPPLSNHTMLKADAYLAEKIGVDATVALLNKIQTINETDFDLSGTREHIFHPIPSLKKRLHHLKVI
jgi:hypothetical protein